MAVPSFVFTISYIVAGLLIFFVGFMLVYKSLQKINLVEGEKFNVEDWVSCVAFGMMFSLSILFALSISAESFLQEYAAVPSVAGYFLLILLAILVVYPLWEVIFLGRPTSDSVHDFHKFLETKILDKFRGGIAYVISFLIFLVIYIAPIFIISSISNINYIEIAFIWFLIFPLFFLNYFAASGQIAGIIGATYTHRHHIDPREEKYLTEKMDPKKPQTVINKILHIVFIVIAWIPFLLSFYNIFGPVSKIIQGVELVEPKDNIMMALISLFTTVVFGIKGFFQRFWQKKSKTKTIDFIFSGYIFIAIGVNMLINFASISPEGVQSVMGISIGSAKPLEILLDLFNNTAVLLPIIILQSSITIIYGIYAGFQKNSDFHADIRLAAVNTAFGTIDYEKLSENETDKNKKKVKAKKYDIDTLIKSSLLVPQYNKYGVDVNEPVRKKAAQYLYLIAVENEEKREIIVDIICKNTIEKSDQNLKDLSLAARFFACLDNLLIKMGLKNADEGIFLSKEAVDFLGEIGTDFPDLVTERLIKAIDGASVQLQQYILDALGDVGEVQQNLNKVLDNIENLLISPRYEIRTAANSAIVEMVLEGDYQNEEFVNTALKVLYLILEKEKENEEIIETTLEAILRLCAKIPKSINISKITPFLDYEKDSGKHNESIGFILQYTINILGYTVYYNLKDYPIAKIREYLHDKREFVRYVAADAVGNYILKSENGIKSEILPELMDLSLNDEDPDVTEMGAESVAEFIVMNKKMRMNEYSVNGKATKILDYYINALDSSTPKIAENASEALKSIAPLYEEDIYDILATKIQGKNKEIARDCMHTLGLLGEDIHKQVNLDIIYQYLNDEDPVTRSVAVFSIGMMASSRSGDIDESKIISLLDDKDPIVRLETIFALGKIGAEKPNEITPILIEKFFNLDRQSNEFVSETELYAESLGIIGERNPSNEIIVTLQQALMGDTNPFSKDIIARALYMIGEGMIRSGNAIRRINNDAFYNQISWLQFAEKKEYTIGNLMIIMIEALQQKGIPESVMNIISDSMQDLFPVFLFSKQEKSKKGQVLTTIKGLLAQAYYSNYNQEILETMDRIDSLLSFKSYFEIEDPILKEQALFYAKQFTPDGKQFHDQGEIFLLLKEQDPRFLEYALKSFEISIELAPYEYYTPNCMLQLGKIFKQKGEYKQASERFEQALEVFASLDEISAMRDCEKNLSEIKKLQ